MKIAIDCRMYESSGIGTHIREILPIFLEESGKENLSFLLIGDSEELVKLREKNIESIEVLECSIKPFSMRELFLFPIKRVNECDIFYTPYINIPGGIKIPIHSTIHDMLFFDMPEMSSKLGILIRKLFYKRAYRLSNKIFTVSEFSRKRIEYHLGKKKKILIAPNGISSHILDENERKYQKKNYIIFIGNIKKNKGLKTLLLAYREAKKEGMTGDFIIVGNQNNFRSRDREIIQMLKNSKEEGIKFTGFVENSELKKLIAEARVLVQPSFYEGFGIPPMEALALGTEVILSDIEVFKEIYGKFPVEFFKVGDTEELKEGIKNGVKGIKHGCFSNYS